MKRLLLLRHAKSSWDNDRLSDHERPLNERGVKDAPKMGKVLKREGLTPDVIVSSSAARAAATAELVALATDFEGSLSYTDRLYLAPPSVYLALARELSDSITCALLVGHNPGIEDLVRVLAGHDERMPTAALAHFELPIESWSELGTDTQAVLRAVWRPKEL